MTITPLAPRFALYFAPESTTPLWRFGSGMIGYDAVTGADLPPPANAPLPPEAWRAATAEPRRYGFHATLKAPFHVRPGTEERQLVIAAETVARHTAPFDLGHLKVALLGSFAALIPVAAPPALATLAAGCVRDLDDFRAPLTEADRARRNAGNLTDRQRDYLERWGYPHVFDEFKFHMTLTGRLDAAVATSVANALAKLYAPLAAPIRIDAIALFRQDNRESRFRVVRRIPLCGPS